MKNNHTPGPWEWSDWYGPEGKEKRNLQPPPGHGTILVAVEMHINRSAYKMTEANAHLISAAPELLQALVELIQIVEVSFPKQQETWLFQARTAVAKAKGEEV